MTTKPSKKIEVTKTLKGLRVGEMVILPLAEVNESSVRSRCSSIGTSFGAKYKIVREFPNLKVTRVI